MPLSLATALMIIGLPLEELPECKPPKAYRYMFSGDLVDMDNVNPNEIIHCSVKEQDS